MYFELLIKVNFQLGITILWMFAECIDWCVRSGMLLSLHTCQMIFELY